VKVLGLLKGGMSLVEVGLCDGEKWIQHSQYSTELYPEHSWFFLKSGFLGTTHQLIQGSAVLRTWRYCENSGDNTCAQHIRK
jgi:hypothetical protein